MKSRITSKNFYIDENGVFQICGFCIVDGYMAMQNANAFAMFYELLDEVRPSQILEIGTSAGGLTNFIFNCINELGLDTKLISYDILNHENFNKLKEKGIDIRVEDIFSNNYELINEEVKQFIQSEGTTIVLCDGGYKKGEFNELSSYIKSGDLIMAHDYAPNLEYFEENINGKLWNWAEIIDEDIAECCDKNNLVNYNFDKCVSAVWACKKKL